MKKKLIFIFNPKAGKGKIRNSLMDVVDIFNKSGYEVLIHATQCPRDAYVMAKEYAFAVDLIVCSGGDGTLDEVITGVRESGSSVPIGYIPAGSTNDFANSLFMPKSMTAAASMIMEEQLYHCDIGRFNDRTFAYVAAFGLFTDVSYQTDQDLKNILGHTAYVLEGAKRLFDIKSYRMTITTEQQVIEGDFMLGMITNSRSVGGFKNLTGKNVDMNDGLFEATFITLPKNPMELQEIISSLVIAEDHSELIYSFKTRKLMIQSEDVVPWTLDGEFGGDQTRVEIENLHGALNLYLTSTKKEKKSISRRHSLEELKVKK
ncbi:MAG: YegS/Rv2252/BmrU family lipid kinase [Eubacteriales bacterium]|nr:YegS/Rv2252/BmrU family lipid kinase [Eubacteriales bacterium]